VTTAPDRAVAALRCSFASEQRGDPFVGTAAPAVGLLLIEQPGPWGRQALLESRLDPAIGEVVGSRAVSRGLRPLLIRRPGRGATSVTRRWAVVDCRPGREVIRWGRFTDERELLDLPLDSSAGDPSYEPAYLVCTHGRHDACCAIRGRPVAEALQRVRPEAVWECSHVGGDRFAANLLALPHGLYYGRVDGSGADEVVAAHERGEVLPSLLRGRTTFLPAAQAAQGHARTVLGALAINALNPVAVLPLTGHRWDVRMRHQPSDLLATVRGTSKGPAALLTCHAGYPAHPPAYEVSDLRELGTPPARP
jgi:hypothetical protein